MDDVDVDVDLDFAGFLRVDRDAAARAAFLRLAVFVCGGEAFLLARFLDRPAVVRFPARLPLVLFAARFATTAS